MRQEKITANNFDLIKTRKSFLNGAFKLSRMLQSQSEYVINHWTKENSTQKTCNKQVISVNVGCFSFTQLIPYSHIHMIIIVHFICPEKNAMNKQNKSEFSLPTLKTKHFKATPTGLVLET